MTAIPEPPAGPVVVPPPQWAALVDAYASPPRAYHNIQHVFAVMQHFDAVAAQDLWRDPAAAFMAVLYHDAIYEPGASDNEARSAELAREHLQRWHPGVDAARVVQLIELTARHGQLSAQDADDEAALFLDCDMAILGADAASFSAYDRAIAAEYRGIVPPWLFRLNRRRFLKALQGRERIFLSDFFHEQLDASARVNLRRAITEKR